MKKFLYTLAIILFASPFAFSQIKVSPTGDVGVGTETPSAKLDVEGTMQLKDGTEGDNLILTSDSVGNASWQNLSTESIFGSLPINDPSCLAVTKTFTGGGNTTVVSGNYLYVRVPGTGGPGPPFTAASVDIFDVTNPASPIFVNNLVTSGFQYEFSFLEIRNNILSLIGSNWQELFDVTNPLAPVAFGSNSYVSPSATVYNAFNANGNCAYFFDTNSSGEIEVMSLDGTTSCNGVGNFPFGFAGPFPTGFNVTEVIVAGNRYYYTQSNKLYRLRGIPPLDTVSVNIPGITNSTKLAASGNYLIAFLGNSARIINVSDTSNIFIESTIQLSGSSFSDIEVKDGKIYILDSGTSAVHMYDFSDPAAPLKLASINITPSSASNLYFSDGNLYARGGSTIDEINTNPCYDQSNIAFDEYGNLTYKKQLWECVGTDIYNSNTDKVGIGTNSPTDKLHVIGTTKFDGYSYQCYSKDNSLGNVGIGGFTYNNVKMMVTSNQDWGLRIDGDSTNFHALEVIGDAAKNGTNTWTVTSDRRLKENIVAYEDGLEKLMEINPVKFNYNKKAGWNSKIEYVGVIAQELKEVAPYMVGTTKLLNDDEEYLSVNNGAMTYMLINSVKEQQEEIEALRASIITTDEVQTLRDELKTRDEQIDKLQSTVNVLVNQIANLNMDFQKCCSAHSISGATGSTQ